MARVTNTLPKITSSMLTQHGQLAAGTGPTDGDGNGKRGPGSVTPSTTDAARATKLLRT